MAEHHQAFHAGNTTEPGAQALDGVMVDRPFGGERGNGSGNEAAEIDVFHVISFENVELRLPWIA
jgi:hypothetical protein